MCIELTLGWHQKKKHRSLFYTCRSSYYLLTRCSSNQIATFLIKRIIAFWLYFKYTIVIYSFPTFSPFCYPLILHLDVHIYLIVSISNDWKNIWIQNFIFAIMTIEQINDIRGLHQQKNRLSDYKLN